MKESTDASTSTDDFMKDNSLRLFYFSHPFGVLSPEPPLVLPAPAPMMYPRCQPAWERRLPPLRLPAPNSPSPPALVVRRGWGRPWGRVSLPPLALVARRRRSTMRSRRRTPLALTARGGSSSNGGRESCDTFVTIPVYSATQECEIETAVESSRGCEDTQCGEMRGSGSASGVRANGAASPGLLHRRYSVPETVMRKYVLSQQKSECEAEPPPSECSRGSCGALCERFPRERDSDEMRRSALMRRMWRHCPPVSQSTSMTSWSTPKRQRLHSPVAPPLHIFTPSDTSDNIPTTDYSSRPKHNGTTDLVISVDDYRTTHASCNTSMTVETEPYETLEIVVSESLTVEQVNPPSTSECSSIYLETVKSAPKDTFTRNVNIDEYVSNILVESLNSLTDQIECVNAAMGGDRKISVVEKEIKVKLQNTGVNTIVHLSPTSNHQIIFGNEELCTAEAETPVTTAPDLDTNDYMRSSSLDVNAWSTIAPSVENNGPASECNSLVDSLEDNATPRVLAELSTEFSPRPALHKPETFFIRIKDDNCDCEKENVVVADHMPEKIKEKLSKRHRRRELRMECARRARAEHERKKMEAKAAKENRKTKKEIEKESFILLNSLVDELIAKIAQDEYKCARIKQRPTRLTAAKSEENVARKHWLKETVFSDDVTNGKPLGMVKMSSVHFSSDDILRDYRAGEKPRVRGKLSLQPRPPPTPVKPPRRLYQKSEIHEGDKCVEILEILEYLDTSHSSTDSTNSDENHNFHLKHRKSRIPVPVYDRKHKLINLENGYSSYATQFFSKQSMNTGERPSLVDSGIHTDVVNANVEAPHTLRRECPPIPEERRVPSTRSAGTSPPPVKQVTHGTMTSPHRRRRRSAATSPAPPTPPVTVGHREGTGEKSIEKEVKEVKSAGVQCEGEALNSRVRNRVDRLLTREEETLHSKARSRVDSLQTQHAKEKKKHQNKKETNRRYGEDRWACGSCSDSDSSSSSSLLCALAPKWLHRRGRKSRPDGVLSGKGAAADGWSVTVAGSCRAALPHDVEMRLRFPQPPRNSSRRSPSQDRDCGSWCGCSTRAGSRADHTEMERRAIPPQRANKLTLTMRKEARDSSIVASKSRTKSSEPLPAVETYRARTKRTHASSCIKTRRHCCPPHPERTPASRPPLPTPPMQNDWLSVLGNGITPQRKPRVPTNTQRDLTRRHNTRRHAVTRVPSTASTPTTLTYTRHTQTKI